MADTLKYWVQLYEKFKFDSRCIDIEASRGMITLIGIYQPRDGLMEHEYFLRGRNLTIEDIAPSFVGCKMIIAYNGISMDVPMINKFFPGLLPKVPLIDLYLWAKRLDLDTNLKVLEYTLGIDRMHEHSKRRFIASKLWQRYEKYHDEIALEKLIEYNKQDTINLYPLAEKLVEIYRQKMS